MRLNIGSSHGPATTKPYTRTQVILDNRLEQVPEFLHRFQRVILENAEGGV